MASAMPSPETQFPAKLGVQRNYLSCEIEGPRDTHTFNYAGSFASLGVNDSFSVSKFQKEMRLSITHLDKQKLVFELINADVSIANAIRRILIAEVPTVAIETVHLWQNTGVIQDEVLAHRLGLIPFAVNPDLLASRKENEDLTEDNCLKFSLHVKCSAQDIRPPLTHFPVYASHLKWIPMTPKQKEKFKDQVPVPVEPEILITKLRPGQEIEAELYCEKGIGKTHAKWSPVATAVYRLLPQFEFPNGPVTGEEAVELKGLCPMGVFDVEDGNAVASYPRKCTTCRACLERFPGKVNLLKNKKHFIFTVESTGSIPAAELFERAVKILKAKAVKIRNNLTAALSKSAMEE